MTPKHNNGAIFVQTISDYPAEGVELEKRKMDSTTKAVTPTVIEDGAKLSDIDKTKVKWFLKVARKKAANMDFRITDIYRTYRPYFGHLSDANRRFTNEVKGVDFNI